MSFSSSTVAVNYSNANKSISMSTGEIACKLHLFSAAEPFPFASGSYFRPRPSGFLLTDKITLAQTAAYAAATVASCSIAVGLSQLVPRLRVSPAARSLLGKLVPFAAVASAGCVNIGLMRWKEMRDGESARELAPLARARFW